MFRKSIHEVLALHTRQLTDLQYDHLMELKYLEKSIGRDINRVSNKLAVNARRTSHLLLNTNRMFNYVNSAFYAIFDWCKRGIDSTEWCLQRNIQERHSKYFHKIGQIVSQWEKEQSVIQDALRGK